MGDVSQQIGDNELRRRFEGQLSKFTNVVKGWQFRWFVLDPESGRLEYYLLEERNGRCRGSHYLAGALVLPSDEDSQTFSVNFASGEVYKVRAVNPRERQIWVDRIRACAHFHNEALASNHPTLTSRELMPPTPPGSRSHIAKNGQPSEELISLSLSAMDAFASVHDIIHKVAGKHDALCEQIESLPMPNHKNYPEDKKPASELQASLKDMDEFTCLNDNLLVLKSTSQSTLICLENALGILQDVREQELSAVAKPVIKSRSQAKGFLPPSPSRRVAPNQQQHQPIASPRGVPGQHQQLAASPRGGGPGQHQQLTAAPRGMPGQQVIASPRGVSAQKQHQLLVSSNMAKSKTDPST